MTRSIHPFPARMAPELAIREVKRLKGTCTVLDPMSGSGTVLREASDRGHAALGYDLDPLAVLMAKVWTTQAKDDVVARVADSVLASASKKKDVVLPWMDRDEDTVQFTKFWFGLKQRRVLRRIAWAIHSRRCSAHHDIAVAIDVLRLALSRIIVTKDSGASLGRDVSHSRPHREWDTSDYYVLDGFERSVRFLRNALRDEPPGGGAEVRWGDARRLRVKPGSVDLVLTSPPYLNAIDYLRGHRLSLVWLGHPLSELRGIRSESIGAERGADHARPSATVLRIRKAMVAAPDSLEPRHLRMVERYAGDIAQLMVVTKRVLARKGRAVLVVGNSCLKETFVHNSAGVAVAAKLAGLRLTREIERDLPESRRYLPVGKSTNSALAKRMRTESVLSFVQA